MAGYGAPRSGDRMQRIQIGIIGTGWIGVSRSIGHKIGERIRLSPAVMEAAHDIDFIL
jgi:hypothetical protein